MRTIDVGEAEGLERVASSPRSRTWTSGAEMSTRRPAISAMAVEALPIIWFIASAMAEVWSSSSSLRRGALAAHHQVGHHGGVAGW